MKNDRAISELLGWSQDEAEIQRLSERKEEFYREILCQGVVAPLPGVVPWLEVLAAGRVPSVIASSTVRRNIECVIGLLGVDRFFGQIVSAEDVLHGKPSPEIFLLAARRLGLEPARCVVFEDSHVGIEAGLAAGMRVVAVAGTHPASSLQRAHRVVSRLDELTLADLDAWH